MAVKYEELDILGEGIEYAAPTKGNFVLNMLYRQGAWEVRKGFGQAAEFDTLMPFNIGQYVAGGSPTDDWGYREHLGSFIIKTDFGNTQIISVFRALVYTDEASEIDRASPTTGASTWGAQIADVFLVSIYDATTRERWEEPLYEHTASAGLDISDLELRHGNFQSNREDNCQSWTGGQGSDPFFFAEIGDTVYFGSRSVPLYAYSPATFRGNRHRQVATFRDGTHGDGQSGGAQARAEWAGPYSESSLVWRVRPTNGPYTDTYNYRTSSSLPQPEAMIAFDGALPTDDLEAFLRVFNEFSQSPEYYELPMDRQDYIRQIIVDAAFVNEDDQIHAEQSAKKTVHPRSKTAPPQPAAVAAPSPPQGPVGADPFADVAFPAEGQNVPGVSSPPMNVPGPGS